MGLRGPAKTPSVILTARGSWRGGENASEPVATVAAPVMPIWLSKAAKEHWEFIVPQLLERRTLSVADLGLLAMMCTEWAEYQTASKELDKLRKSGRDFHGTAADHPRRRMESAFDRYKHAADRFGLSPSAKARVQSEPEPRKKPAVTTEPQLRIAQ
jgi:P27 family predicted phage terminase small subunit